MDKMKAKRYSIAIFPLLVATIFVTCTRDQMLTPPESEPVLKSANVVFTPEVEAAIESGISWLLLQQNPSDGCFGGGNSEMVARTALAVTKLCDRSIELGQEPLNGPYTVEILKGLNFIFKYATNNPYGGIYLSNSFSHSVYHTGIAMMAIAAARCPDCTVNVPGSLVDGYTFQQVLQVNVNFFTNAQNTDGGWRYYDHSQPSDNSNTGFAVLGLMAAEGAGIEIQPSIKANLSSYIDFIQNDVSGGSGYTTPNNLVNILKTGNLLFEMAFVGDDHNSSRAVSAIQYIQNNWDLLSIDPGWRPNNFLAMYCLMKGFVSLDIDNITVADEEVDWYEDFVEEILKYNPWPLPPSPWLDSYESSIFSMLVLEKITPIPYVNVYVDVKPTSCPNPLNRKAKGVIPVAILGTEDFDVTTIDPATLNIGEVYPLRWDYEDVATPYEGGLSDPLNKMDCTTEGPDGYQDLVLHFLTPELATLFLDNNRNDVVDVQVNGQLLNDGPQIIGKDIMVIIK